MRSLLPEEFDGTLAKVRGDGYTVVEAAGYYDHTAADFRKAMDAAGLRCVSTHYTLALLEAQLGQLMEYAQTLGLEFIVCSSSGGMHRDPQAKGAPTLDDWRWIAGEFNRIGEKVKAAGMIFGYHNHSEEFGNEGGVVFFDELMRLTDPALVVFEMDCGWVFTGGRDPAEYLRATPQRFPLLHLKDIVKGPDGVFHSPLMGRGKIDNRAILRAATGLKHYFVEQEEYDIEPFEALRIDAEYMRKLQL